MTLWLWQSGIPAWIAPLFVFAALVIFIGLTRAIVEAGIPTLSPAMVPLGFVVSGVGVPALGAKGMVASAYTLIWVGELLVFMSGPPIQRPAPDQRDRGQPASASVGHCRGHVHYLGRLHLLHPPPSL